MKSLITLHDIISKADKQRLGGFPMSNTQCLQDTTHWYLAPKVYDVPPPAVNSHSCLHNCLSFPVLDGPAAGRHQTSLNLGCVQQFMWSALGLGVQLSKCEDKMSLVYLEMSHHILDPVSPQPSLSFFIPQIIFSIMGPCNFRALCSSTLCVDKT